MTHTLSAITGAAMLVALSGCGEYATQLPGDDPFLRTAPAEDEGACLNAVAQQANNSVRILRSDTSEANSAVMVGVGPNAAVWKCLAKNGIVAEAYFTGDEGML